MNRPKLRILHVIPSMNIGGREKVVLDILQHIDKKRFLLEVACLGGGGSLYHAFRAKHVALYFLHKKAGFSPAIYFKLRQLIKSRDYDVVHTHNPGGFLYGAVASILAKTPVIINSEHGYGSHISKRKYWAEAFLMNRINMTLAVTKHLEECLSGRPFADKSRIRTLHNGIDCEQYESKGTKNRVEKSLGISSTDIVVGCVGRLAAIKDHETLMRSFKLVHGDFPKTKLVIVGEGENRKSLEALRQTLRLESHIVLTGERNDIKTLLSRMDVFVLSSLNEGISITLLEAMSSGLPVVATSVGGNTEVLENGLCGILVPPRDPEKMAQGILTIISDQGKARSLGKAAKKRVKEKFSIKRVVRELESLYRSLLNMAA